jgi:hypothetical protein
MFLDKYCPKNLKEYVGNNKLIKNILTDILENKKIGSYAITGSIGCGKTLLVKLIAKELKLKLIYVDPDKTSDSDLKKIFQKSFFKRLVLFDDIDLYRGHVKKKIISESAKSSNVLVFFTSKDKMTSCKHIKQFKLRKLTDVQMAKLIKKIIKGEEIKISSKKLDDIINKIIKSSNYDVRNTIITLENLCISNKDKIKLSKSFNDEIKKSTIDTKIEMFESFKIIFSKKASIEKKESVFYNDQFMISHLLYDNIKNINNCTIDNLTYIYDTFGEDDIITERIMKYQDYSLLPYKAVLTTVNPFVDIEMKKEISFPSSISKISKLNKNNGIISDLLVKNNNKVKSTDLYYLNMIKNNKEFKKELKDFTLHN